MLAAIENVSTPPLRDVKQADDEGSFKLMNMTNLSFRHDEFIKMTNENARFVRESL